MGMNTNDDVETKTMSFSLNELIDAYLRTRAVLEDRPISTVARRIFEEEMQRNPLPAEKETEGAP